MLPFGSSPALRGSWSVRMVLAHSAVIEPDAYEEAPHILVRRALADGVAAVALTVSVEEGAPRIVREVLDR
jgi:hypothetical protein